MVNINPKKVVFVSVLAVSLSGCDSGSSISPIKTSSSKGTFSSVPRSSSSSQTSSSAVTYGRLNDTGFEDCADDEATDLRCPQSLYPRQDGDKGRDALARQGLLQKQGGGLNGFDWTKLDADGIPMVKQNASWVDGGSEASGTHWSCVRDNVTGLIWEIKESDENHPRYALHTYHWYSEDATNNGGQSGLKTLEPENCPTAPCNTQHYTEWVNQKGLCGFRDWRMPSVRELMSIAVYSQVGPALDIEYFPNALQPRFFTNQTYAGEPNLAWYVYFSDASTSFTSKTDKSYIRLVRGGDLDD